MLFLFVLIETRAVFGILGGHGISIRKAPYQANYGDICGAVLVHQKWALTSAHCGTDATFIRVGSKYRLRGPKIIIKKHLIHPKYKEEHTFDYDIQLLLFRSLHFSEFVRSIEISNESFGSKVYVSGWGYGFEKGDYNDILQQVELPIIPIRECQKVNNLWYNHTLTSRMFCAGGEGVDACQGDSGGGAVSSGRLVGLSSFGFGCGRRIPGVYTNVTETRVRKWIKEHTGV
ncbi:trypsin-7-like [Manduca sexta]|uniref:trypsin-7-like n=1 Tax=Manduca sexta TaxID=7130 RepID=UPI00188EB3EF|nr:trypsin-7-like [Manduca sexta]